MNISHVGLWVNDIEAMKSFYEKFFNCVSGKKYSNPSKNFESYFLAFKDGSALEIMKDTSVENASLSFTKVKTGYAHIALSTGSKENVISLTQQIRIEGFSVISEPRTTGDGYFESVISDPEGNSIEITI